MISGVDHVDVEAEGKREIHEARMAPYREKFQGIYESTPGITEEKLRHFVRRSMKDLRKQKTDDHATNMHLCDKIVYKRQNVSRTQDPEDTYDEQLDYGLMLNR